MRHGIHTALCVALVGLALGAEPVELKVYFAPRVDAPPTIDGQLDEPFWRTCPCAQEWGFPAYGSRPDKLQPTTFQIGWDDQNLYLGLTAQEDAMDKFRSLLANTAKAIFWRDCFEIYVDGNHDRRTKVQIVANARDEKTIIRTYDPGWGLKRDNSFGLWARWKTRAALSADQWTIEMALSHKDFGTRPEPGYHFGINVARFRFTGGKAEFYTWSNHGTNHQHVSLFGTTILVGGKVEDLASGLRLAYPDLDARHFLVPQADGYLVFDTGRRSKATYRGLVENELSATRQCLAQAEQIAGPGSPDKNVSKLQQELQGIEQTLSKHGPLNAADMRAFRKQIGQLRDRIREATWNLRIARLFSNSASSQER